MPELSKQDQQYGPLPPYNKGINGRVDICPICQALKNPNGLKVFSNVARAISP